MTAPTGGRHDTPTPADALSLPPTAPSPTAINDSCQASSMPPLRSDGYEGVREREDMRGGHR